MTKPNPMEPVFIGMVEKIVEEIFRDHADDAERARILTTLHSHLEKAKRLGTLSYEGETHNAIFIYNIMNGGSRDLLLANLNAAHDCARQAGNIPLQVKILNNTGSYLSGEYDFEQSRRYFDDAIKLDMSLAAPTVAGIFAYTNNISDTVRQGKWQQALAEIKVADGVSKKATVTAVNRNDYARIVHVLHGFDALVRLALGEYDAALSALKLVQTLEQQLGIKGLELTTQRLQALYALIAEGNTTRFEAWFDAIEFGSAFGVTDGWQIVCLLKATGHTEYATKLAKRVLAAAPNQAVRDKIQADFEPLGVA